MNWSVTLEASVPGDDDVLVDAADAYLDVLSRRPDIFGPVTAVNLRDRIVRASFNLEAIDFSTAVRHAAELSTSTLTEAGIEHTTILHAEITNEPIDEDVLATAPA